MSSSVVDSLLASTAHEYDFALVTRKVDDFKSFDIKLLDPWVDE